jgi:hypothetical protein
MIIADPAAYGYRYLGSSSATSEFHGHHVRYLVLPLYANNPVKIDALELLGRGRYWSGCTSSGIGMTSSNFFAPPCDEWPTVPVDEPQNIRGAPDGNYNCLWGYLFVGGVGWIDPCEASPANR